MKQSPILNGIFMVTLGLVKSGGSRDSDMAQFPIFPDPEKTIEAALDAGVKSTPQIVAQLQASQDSEKTLEDWIDMVTAAKNDYSPTTSTRASRRTDGDEKKSDDNDTSNRANDDSVTSAELREALKAANVTGEKAGELPT